MLIERQDREKLKGIVRDFIAGNIFFSAQVRDPSILGMVFMPVAFGAFSYPVEKPTGTVKPAAPVRPVRPVKGEVDAGESGRRMERELAEALENFKEVSYRHRWNDATKEEFIAAQAALHTAVEDDRKAREDAVRKVETEHREALKAYLSELLDYRKARSQWREQVKDWEEGEEGLRNRIAVWEKGRGMWVNYINENLGVIYAEMKDAGPRSINGYPIFWACSYLHKLDWEIVRKAIDRELERMKDIDLGDDPVEGSK